ncbi:Pyruvate dehydrogenase E1 component [Candidatus Kinetoplastibacterium sorsogonicusi]|uniref:Pyruvate dehydrogenase E1 component n=1 Tax=Candidatus Kinetoplastidibacterium kentomonadis TaxID=1576550 RepID=A0A3S7J9R3_9PROT|nr:pyruvate dehydrogenase (acetyl-transferring), homodimeric type [Candidatus Kinetoplastibacterium sorsogonicusi]AWD32404.1 Pyruvate dehydrogenase E1 component [Candidatus Kinetoplastibacterium sorsogonicusi]
MSSLNQMQQDEDSQETKEWLDALLSVIKFSGKERASFLLNSLINKASSLNIYKQKTTNTPYLNTIPKELQPDYPGDFKLESKINSYIRWNAMAMVVKANSYKIDDGGNLGGHLSSFASLATMISCGQNHFWKADNENHLGDLIYFQGHSSPGIYARAYLEGRLSEEHLNNFRQEVNGMGLSSYPHPKLMPNFWQFPTVSVGLGPLMAIYQARFLKYLHARGILDTSDRKVWVFCGDGEMDEPEALGAISLASREKLDNLIFVVNCNLQRLDGPVRGNGKIIQELESNFIGANWNVIKLIWGGYWDDLIESDFDGILKQVMENTVDGEYQSYKAHDGKFVREHFFAKHPKLLERVAHMSDNDLWRLNRGGHDPFKVYAAFKAAVTHKNQPSVILAKTIKGYGLGYLTQSKNPTHQHKKLELQDLLDFRDRFKIPIPDDKVKDLPYFKPKENSPEMVYMKQRRASLGGYIPKRRTNTQNLIIPSIDIFKSILEPTFEGRKISTTQAFVRILNQLLRDKNLGKRIVPIIADEARTFGMEGLFRQIAIYAPEGQKYIPEDKNQVMYYREEQNGQLIQEGINEAGAMSSWIAAATSYSTNNYAMIPFYIYYSMFGFQRVGDLVWAAGDMQARGFLLGGTSGRTTLNGEGLQHEDGHSHILSSVIPNCISYDPAFAHELAVIIHSGLKRMFEQQDNVFYYITVMNANYEHPGLKFGDEDGIIKGMYMFNSSEQKDHRIQLMGCGAILQEVIEAQSLLLNDWNIGSDIWSVTSFTELNREGMDISRFNMLNATDKKIPYVTEKLNNTIGPIIASTDYVQAFANQIRQFIPKNRIYKVLGSDGFGRSDFRNKLRDHFEISSKFIVLEAINALIEDGKLPASKSLEVIEKYNININKMNPHYA